MKYIIALLLVIGGFSLGLSIYPFLPIRDSQPISTNVISSSISPDIEVNTALVCNTISYGYVSEGSIFFDISKSVKGFQILIKNGTEIISTTYCNQLELQHYLDLCRYKLSIRDSLITTKP